MHADNVLVIRILGMVMKKEEPWDMEVGEMQQTDSFNDSLSGFMTSVLYWLGLLNTTGG
jgi:hypothetical protein